MIQFFSLSTNKIYGSLCYETFHPEDLVPKAVMACNLNLHVSSMPWLGLVRKDSGVYYMIDNDPY